MTSSPPTLQRHHLSLFIRYLRRKAKGVRFFASGEYGDTTYRPHYHAILFGLPDTTDLVQQSWTHGFARVDPLTPAAISYVAGYCSKKLGHKLDSEERIDYRTGELFTFQPPFLQMSRRPGIAGSAREHASSWRSHAVLNGSVMPVPRYLHEAWKARATPEDLLKLEEEKAITRRHLNADVSLDRTMQDKLRASERIAEAQHALQTSKRTL